MSGRFISRLPDVDYRAIDALNISRLKQLRRSPLHYLHLMFITLVATILVAVVLSRVMGAPNTTSPAV